ncbi:glutamate--tRNA ligase [Nitratifractor sp.]
MLRFVYSPRFDLNVADLRLALINYLLSRQRREDFLLVIDDRREMTDQEATRAAEAKELLDKFALHSERQLYRSEARNRYQQLALHLLESGKAFLCTCEEKSEHAGESEGEPRRYSGRCLRLSPEELRKIRDENLPFTIRIHKPAETIVWRDLLQGEFHAAPEEVDHFVLRLSDGSPSHTFADAVDEMSNGISLVIEEEQHLREVPRQIHLRRSLGYEEEIAYAHIPPLLDETGRKFSRLGAPSVKALLTEGFLPDALINYLLRLGNESLEGVFTLAEAVESFDLRHLSPDPVRFDLDELRTLNREHLRRMDGRTLSLIFGFADASIGRLAKLYLEEAPTIGELEEKIRKIFAPKQCEGAQAEVMRRLSEAILSAPYFADFDAFENDLGSRTGLEGETLRSSLYRLLTGSDEGPALPELYTHIKSYITEVARCQH